MPCFGMMRGVQDTANRIRNLKFDLYVAQKDRSPYVEEIAAALADVEAEWPVVCPAANRCCSKGKEQRREDDDGRRLPPLIVCDATTEEWANALNICPYTRY